MATETIALADSERRISDRISTELGIRRQQTEAVISLIDEGNTIPFITRYRKEATGAMDDEALRAFEEKLKYLRALESRKATVIASIEKQGNLTEELRNSIETAETAVAVEDLYRPYKPRRKTRAMIAREKGLEGLAVYMLAGRGKLSVEAEAEKYINEEKGVHDIATAISLAQDIIAGDVSDNAEYRNKIRSMTSKKGAIVCSLGAAGKEAVKNGQRTPYENYYEFREPLQSIPGHRLLAINRGEKEKVLSVSIDAPSDEITDFLVGRTADRCSDQTREFVDEAVRDGYKRLIAPSIETDLRNDLTEAAEEGAIKVFAANLRQLLMQPPIRDKVVLGWDPAFRTGCKLAVCEATGKILETAVIFPTAPQNKVAESKAVLKKLADKYDIDIISLGNGTASRESEKIIAEFINEYAKSSGKKLQYVIVNEAGASVYSASKLATKEYPDLDVGERSSASIARRLQDPLSELVKIEPKAIGVGQYQHDMNQTRLGEALSAVVEDCVNAVGVDLNTTSPSLLEYVAGITKPIAAGIVKYRDEHGRFDNRSQLLAVPKLGPKAFEQAAGFLRISGGSEPLDASAVHPESYAAARMILAGADAAQAGVGEYTYKDILSELEKPSRDPRENAEAPVLRSDVLEMSDLKPGMELKGTIRNIVDFGAFVDIGVHQDGLVHISQLSDRYVKHPLDLVKVGDIVKVTVISVDEERGKISLTMKSQTSKQG